VPLPVVVEAQPQGRPPQPDLAAMEALQRSRRRQGLPADRS